MTHRCDPVGGAASFRVCVLLVAAALIVNACGGLVPSPTTEASRQPLETPGSSLVSTPSPSGTPEATSPTTRSPTPLPTPLPTPGGPASCAQAVLTQLTLPQRIGQLVALGLRNNQLGPAERNAIEVDHVGSVWFTAKTSLGVAGIRAIADAVQAEASVSATGNVGLFVAANQEGGLVQALRGPGFTLIPSAVAQGGWSVRRLTASATLWGQQLAAAGVNLDFGPVADVVPPGTDATNQPIGVLEREYGHDPATAGSHAAALIDGMTAAGVATTAKHFPGLGRVMNNTDLASDVVDTVTTADDPYLGSFKATIDAGVPFVMIALATYSQIDPSQLAAFSPTIIRTILRDKLGFRGVVASDSLTAAAVSAMSPGDRAIDFLRAGGDLIVVGSAPVATEMIAAIEAQVASDPGFAQIVDDAVRLILQAKLVAGLLPCTG